MSPQPKRILKFLILIFKAPDRSIAKINCNCFSAEINEYLDKIQKNFNKSFFLFANHVTFFLLFSKKIRPPVIVLNNFNM